MRNLIQDNLKLFKEKFNEACLAASKKESDISIIAVSKKKDKSLIKEVCKSGINNFGENFAQELSEKAKELKEENIIWHFIGPIQSNKVKLVAANAHWVHSLDREKIISKLNAHCEEIQKIMNVCIQVNIDNENTKSGINPNELLNYAALISEKSHLKLKGIMVLPKITNNQKDNEDVMKKCFALHANLKSAYPGAKTLSMGTTSDFESAIRSGSNMIRVGESIFGKRL